MSAPLAFDYAVVRVVPRVEREEFINAGVILYCPAGAFLGCRLALDEARLCALAPTVDLPAVRLHLAAFAAVCDGQPTAGPIAQLSPSERFHWLVAPRSTMIQTSPMHAGLCEHPVLALEHLFASVVA